MSEHEFDHDLARLGFVDRIKYVTEMVSTKTPTNMLSQIAVSPAAEEIVYNVIRQIAANRSLKMTDELAERVIFLGQARLDLLKSTFPPNYPANRSFPGKMEYDTTLDALRNFREKLRLK